MHNLRIALVADWLTNIGGAEKVIYELHKMFPKAPIYTSVYNPQKADIFKDAEVISSFIQKFPYAKDKHQLYLPFYPYAFEQFDLSNFDIVISSSHSCAKGVITKPQTLHVSYCHSPMRYAWDDCHKYVEEYSNNKFFKAIAKGLIHKLRMWDRLSADRVDYFIANSKYVKKRIKKYYRKDSKVIYPMLDSKAFEADQEKGDYYIALGRLIPYKKFDMVIDVFNDLGFPLKIVGTGISEKELKARAKANIEFCGRVEDKELKTLLSKAKALIFPQVEDFGIVPLEAMASGTPVVAFNKGGAAETVIDEKTGILFDEQNVYALKAAIDKCHSHPFKTKDLIEQAEKFDSAVFQSKMMDFLNKTWEEWQNKMC